MRMERDGQAGHVVEIMNAADVDSTAPATGWALVRTLRIGVELHIVNVVFQVPYHAVLPDPLRLSPEHVWT